MLPHWGPGIRLIVSLRLALCREHQQRHKVGPLLPGQAAEERRQALQLELDGEVGSGGRTLRRSNALTRSAADRAAHVAAGGQPRQKATIPQVLSPSTCAAPHSSPVRLYQALLFLLAYCAPVYATTHFNSSLWH